MSREQSSNIAFDVHVTCDNLVDSPVGPSIRVLGPRLDGDRLRIAVVRDGEVEHLSPQEVVHQEAASRRSRDPDYYPGPQEEVLTWIPANKRAKALTREAHLLDVLYGRTDGAAHSPYDAAATDVTARRQAKCDEIGISQSTMTRDIKDYRKSGVLGLVRALGRALRKTGAADVDPEILAVVKDFAGSRVLQSKKTLNSEYALLLAELGRAGLVTVHQGVTTPDGRAIPLAHEALPYPKFVRLIRHLGRGRDPRTAKTRQQQSNRPLVTAYRHRGFDFADHIEMDSTPVDVFVRGANDSIRAHAVFAVCTSTRYVWVRVTAGPPRGRDLALLLWDMAGGESAFAADSPVGASVMPTVPRNKLAINAWRGKGKPPASIPGCIVLDHGAEEENNRLLRYTAQLGVDIIWARTRQGSDKPYVESSINTYARACELVPGHKGNTVENRPSAEPTYIPTIEQLRAVVAEWQQVHVNREHTGLPHPHNPGRFLTPMEAVHVSMTRGIPLRGLTDPARALGLLAHTNQTPQDDGVTFRRRRYVCPRYEDIITASIGRDGRRGKVTFYYDPNRPGRLYWRAPGEVEVRILMDPEEAGEAVAPFADIREHWLAAVQGHKLPTPTQHGMRTAALVEAMTAAMETTGDNVIPLDLNMKKSPGTKPSRPTTGGWDMRDVMDLIHSDESVQGEP